MSSGDEDYSDDDTFENLDVKLLMVLESDDISPELKSAYENNNAVTKAFSGLVDIFEASATRCEKNPDLSLGVRVLTNELTSYFTKNAIKDGINVFEQVGGIVDKMKDVYSEHMRGLGYNF